MVYTPHGYAHILMGKGGLKLKGYEIMEKVLGKRPCITLTCCKSEDDVAKTLTKRTAYVETGVNLKDLSESLDGIKPIKNDKFTVYTLGRTVCRNNQNCLIVLQSWYQRLDLCGLEEVSLIIFLPLLIWN